MVSVKDSEALKVKCGFEGVENTVSVKDSEVYAESECSDNNFASSIGCSGNLLGTV